MVTGIWALDGYRAQAAIMPALRASVGDRFPSPYRALRGPNGRMYYGFSQVLQPYPFILLVMGLLLALAWRDRARRGWLLRLGTAAYLSLLFLSLPFGSYLVLGTLERMYPQRVEWPDDAEAIVVLSGSISRASAVRTRAEAGDSTALRCIAAAEVYHQQGPLPMVVTGGSLTRGPSAAIIMSKLLVDLGVDRSDILLEKESQSTYENAMYSARLLEQRDIQKVFLVSDASHLLRSELCFRKQGLSPIPVACNHRAATLPEKAYQRFVPGTGPLRDCEAGFHEWLGLVWYWLRGRI